MSLRFKSYFVNALTLSRIPLIFCFMIGAVIAQLRGGPAGGPDPWPAFAAGMFMFLAGISDLFDGKLARRWKVVSTFGKMADPLMDKVYFIVSFPTLLWMIGAQGGSTTHTVVMLAFTVLYILRDQWVTFLRAIASSYKADVSAMWLGKVRTALSFPAAGYIYAYLSFHGLLPVVFTDDATCAAVDHGLLVSVYCVEGFLIALNLYSCLSYTKVYWPYMVRAIGAK